MRTVISDTAFNDTIKLTDGLSTRVQWSNGWAVWLYFEGRPLMELCHVYDDELYNTHDDDEGVIAKELSAWHLEVTSRLVNEGNTEAVVHLIQRAEMLAAASGCRVGQKSNLQFESVYLLRPGALNERLLVTAPQKWQMATLRVWACTVTKLQAKDYDKTEAWPWIFGETS